MKFFFSIITFFFVLITQSYSQNCNPDEYNDGMMIKEYEAEYNYKAEEAYLFGKKIQKLLLDKDLKGFIDVTTGNLKTDLENRFKNTQSIEAFFSPDAFNKITKGKVYCKPMGISGAKTFWIGLSDLVYTLKDGKWLVTEYKNADFSFNNFAKDYSIMLEESNKEVMLVNRYPPYIEINDYGKFVFARIAYLNAKNNETPLFIQPSNIEIKGDYKSLMKPKYQIDNVAYEFIEDDEKQTIKIKSTNNNLNINNKIEEYFKGKSELTATILSGGVYTSSKFSPVTDVKQLKDLFKDNPQTFCKLLSEKNISGIINRELKSDLNSLFVEEIKECEDKNIIINISSNRFLEKNRLPKLICTQLSNTGEAMSITFFDLSEKKKYEDIKISNSDIRFTFYTVEHYVSARLDRLTNKLRLLNFSDLNHKHYQSSVKYSCENIDEITDRIVKKSEPNIAWKVDGKFIIPECFDTVWLSGDNYEAFYEQYIKDDGTAEWGNKSFQNFVVNIGTHLNREIPLNHSINPGWSGVSSLSLTKSIKGCLSKEAHTDVMYEITTYYDGNKGNTQNDIGYEVLEDYDVSIGKKLAPHIKLQFESIKKVEVSEWGGGSMGHTYRQITYGLISIDGQKVLLPLKNHIKFN